MSATQEVVPQAAPLAKTTVAVGERGMVLNTLDEVWRFASCLAKSGMAPKNVDTPEAITIAIQMGMELGLSPMAAIQNIAVINGRPAIWGDAQLAVCRASAHWDEKGFSESWEGEEGKDDFRAIVSVQRKGGNPCVRTFSVRDAKTAQLWGKQGPWSQYPKRMLQMRARSYALRDTFGDVLRGFHSVEEVRDGGLKEVEGAVIETAPTAVEKTKTLAAKIKAAGKAEGSAAEGNPAGGSRSAESEPTAKQAAVVPNKDESPSAPAVDPKADLINALTDLLKAKTHSFVTLEEARQIAGVERFKAALRFQRTGEDELPKLKAPAIKNLLIELIGIVKEEMTLAKKKNDDTEREDRLKQEHERLQRALSEVTAKRKFIVDSITDSRFVAVLKRYEGEIESDKEALVGAAKKNIDGLQARVQARRQLILTLKHSYESEQAEAAQALREFETQNQLFMVSMKNDAAEPEAADKAAG